MVAGSPRASHTEAFLFVEAGHFWPGPWSSVQVTTPSVASLSPLGMHSSRAVVLDGQEKLMANWPLEQTLPWT